MTNEKADDELVQVPSDGRIPGNGSSEDPTPRRLFEGDGKPSHGVHDTNNFSWGGSEDEAGELVGFMDMQNEMKKFACETRAALREQSFTEHGQGPSSKFLPVSVASPLSVKPSAETDDPSARTSQSKEKVTIGSESTGTEFADLQANEMPVLIRSMDCFDGIAKGDITLSLLSENTGMEETSVGATWANRVKGAIWRSRRMRNMLQATESHPKHGTRSPARGRSSLPVDVDKARVAGNFRTVASTQEAALLHLKHDELDESIELFEDIIFAYYSYFEKSLNMREKNPNLQSELGTIDFKPYIGVALHNLGILNLLNGEYGEALSFFNRAMDNRRGHLGENHPDHIVRKRFNECELCR
jgi:hypothetical protein